MKLLNIIKQNNFTIIQLQKKFPMNPIRGYYEWEVFLVYFIPCINVMSMSIFREKITMLKFFLWQSCAV